MLTWLKSKPASTRRAARPAKLFSEATKKRPVSPVVEEDMPPPFFADNDTAFLDMGDVPAKVTVEATVKTPIASSAAKLAQAVLDLPPFPERFAGDRMGQLLHIYRSLDRIAGEVCDDESLAPNNC